MTISTTDDPVAGPFEGDDSQTVFPFTFKVFAAADLDGGVVAEIDGSVVDLVRDSDYSVSLNADQNANPGGSVTYPLSGSPLATGDTLTIASNLEYTQPASIPNRSGFYARVVEDALDRVTMLIKQASAGLSRALRFPLSDAGVNTELPPAAERSLKVLGFDSDGNPTVLAPASGSATDLALTLAGLAGAGFVGHSWSTDYDDSTSGQHIQDAQGPINVMRAIAKAKRAAIRAFTSTDDVATELQSILTNYAAFVPEGGFRTNAKLTTSRSVRGASSKLSQILPLANTFDALELTDTTAEFIEVSDLRIIFPSKGTGDGVVLANNNNNVELSRINVQNADIAFNAKYVAFMQRFQQLRADGCNTGFYADGRNSGGTGAGTTLIYDQCYATNSTGVGWNLNFIRSVEMIQPATDMAGMTLPISTVGVGHLNIFGHHFEGTPGGDGAFITYTTSGSLANGINVIGGALENNNLSALTYNYLNINANDDHVRVVLIGVNARNLTGGANAKFAKLTGTGASVVDIVTIGCNFGALEGLFDLTGFSGSYTYRKIEDEKVILARGVTSVAGGGVIDTGLSSTDDKHIVAQVRVDTTTLPTVMAHITETYSGNGNVQIKFSKLTDGTNDTGTYPVQWVVFS